MKEVKLMSGRKVKIKSMTIDQIDECKDIPELIYKDGPILSIGNKVTFKKRGQYKIIDIYKFQ